MRPRTKDRLLKSDKDADEPAPARRRKTKPALPRQASRVVRVGAREKTGLKRRAVAFVRTVPLCSRFWLDRVLGSACPFLSYCPAFSDVSTGLYTRWGSVCSRCGRRPDEWLPSIGAWQRWTRATQNPPRA